MTKVQSTYQLQLRAQAVLLRQEADTLPRGRARDALLQQAQRLDRSAIVEGWVSCNELQPPKANMNEPHDNANVDARTNRGARKAG
jgi:hypothetical protein